MLCVTATLTIWANDNAGQGSFDLPHDLAMDWNVGDLHTSSVPEVQPISGPLQMPTSSTPQPQPFAGPVSRLGWASQTPVPMVPSASTPPAVLAPAGSPLSPHSSLGPGVFTPSDRSPGDGGFGQFPPQTEPPPPRPAFPAIPRSARRASAPATAPGGASNFITNQLFETRSTPPLWTIGEGDATDGPDASPHSGMRPAMSADANGFAGGLRGTAEGATASSAAGRRLRPSVRSASVGANSERPLSSSDLDLGLSGAKAKERNRSGPSMLSLSGNSIASTVLGKLHTLGHAWLLLSVLAAFQALPGLLASGRPSANALAEQQQQLLQQPAAGLIRSPADCDTTCLRCRRAQKRFRERQKVKQQEAVQRVVQLEEALDRLEVERSELSQRLRAMANGRGDGGGGVGTPHKAEDPGSEVRPFLCNPCCLTLQLPCMC